MSAVLAGCSESDSSAAPAETVTVTETATATVTTEVTVTAEPTPTIDPASALFPEGYPRLVSVDEVDEPVRTAAFEGETEVVAIAPGVWTKLTPGATVMDAALSGSADGFCASRDAYEREYGQVLGGSCW